MTLRSAGRLQCECVQQDIDVQAGWALRRLPCFCHADSNNLPPLLRTLVQSRHASADSMHPRKAYACSAALHLSVRVQELADESAARFGRHRAALKEVSARLRQGAAALRAAAARDNRFYAQATQLQRFWKVGARAGQQAEGLG